MKTKINLILAVVLLTGSACAETLHVTTVRDWQPNDPAPVSRAFRVQVIEGRVGETTYTAQQMLSWGVSRVEVGRDYEVVKTDARSMTVVVLDKKGRPSKERLDVTGVQQ
jgi:hypothetical protein